MAALTAAYYYPFGFYKEPEPQATCSVTLQTFSDSNCNTAILAIPLPGVIYFNGCYENTIIDRKYNGVVCDSTLGYVILESYPSSSSCEAAQLNDIIIAKKNECWLANDNTNNQGTATYVKVTAITTSGIDNEVEEPNYFKKYGLKGYDLGYFEAIAIFTCQVMLFGLCTGLDD